MKFAAALGFAIGVLTYTAPAAAQAREMCLHSGPMEAPAEARRREDALGLVRMINTVAANRPNRTPAYRSWDEIVNSPQVAALRGAGGPAGDLARKVQWGSDEPLPQWALHYIVGEGGYAFSLTDTRDPCAFTYHSNETGVIIEGQPITRRGPAIVPLS